MGEKFSIVDSKLFTDNGPSRLPEWMKDFRDQTKDIIDNRQAIELEFDKKGKFEEHNSVYRPELDASCRKIEASYDSERMKIESKIELSKFLKGRYYKTNVRTAGTKAYLDTTIDGIQANFTFGYEFANGKIKQASTFYVNDSEYPFNKFGLEESIDDLKNGTLKKSNEKIASTQAYVINREDIVRRYNGQIREATTAINSYLREGLIVGVSSNAYGTFYDPDELFPKMQKEIPAYKLGSFEYVNNTEHVATNEKKSDKNLSLEASNMLGSIFKDYIVESYNRNNDNFKVAAKVLSNTGKVCNVDFNFDISNEKIASLRSAKYNNKQMSLSSLLNTINNKTTEKTASRIYNNAIVSKNELTTKLATLVKSSEIDDFINGLIEIGELNQINSNTYSATTTIDDMISKMSFEKLSEREINRIVKAGRKYENDIERYEAQEYNLNDSTPEISNEKRLFLANSYLTKHFASFCPKKVGYNKNSLNYKVELFDDISGLKNDIEFELSFNDDKITKCCALINGKKIDLDKVKEVFAKNSILSKYLAGNSNKKVSSSTIFSKDSLVRKLKNIAKLDNNEIDLAINNWLKMGKVNEISHNVYASKNTLEQLLSISNLKPLSDEEIIEKLRRSKNNKELVLTANYVQDNDTREMEEKWSSQSKALHSKVVISGMFKDFDILDAEDKEDHYTITAKVINPFNGLKQGLKFKFATNRNKIGDIVEISDGNKSVAPNNVIELLENTNKAVNKYASLNDTRNSNKIIISKTDLKNKLLPIVGYENVDKSISKLAELNVLNNLNSNSYYSDISMSEIVKYLSDNNMTNIREANRNMVENTTSSLSVDLRGKYVFDTDNRAIEKKEESLTPDMVNTAKKLDAIIKDSYNKKKITANKKNLLSEKLSSAKNPNDIEYVWRELKKFL